MTDWKEWKGAPEVPEDARKAKNLWVRYRDGYEQKCRDNWRTDDFLWSWDRYPSFTDVVAYRVE